MAQHVTGRAQVPGNGAPQNPHHIMWDKALEDAREKLGTESGLYEVQVEFALEISPNPGKINAYVVRLNTNP